jgi:hypothetical protein
LVQARDPLKFPEQHHRAALILRHQVPVMVATAGWDLVFINRRLDQAGASLDRRLGLL